MARWVLLIVALAWGMLFFSSSAILVWSDGPHRPPGYGADTLDCMYFTGLGFVEKGFWYDWRSACPRIIPL